MITIEKGKGQGSESALQAKFNRTDSDGYKFKIHSYYNLPDKNHPILEDVEGVMAYGIENAVTLLTEVAMINNPDMLKKLLDDSNTLATFDVWGFLRTLHPESPSREVAITAMAGVIAYNSLYADDLIAGSGMNISDCIEADTILSPEPGNPCAVFRAIMQLVLDVVEGDIHAPELTLTISYLFAVEYRKRKYRLFDATGDEYVAEEVEVDRHAEDSSIAKAVEEVIAEAGLSPENVKVLRLPSDIGDIKELIKSLVSESGFGAQAGEQAEAVPKYTCDERMKAMSEGVLMPNSDSTADSYNALLEIQLDVKTRLSNCVIIDMGKSNIEHFAYGIKLLQNVCGYSELVDEKTGHSYIAIGDLGYLSDLYKSKVGGEAGTASNKEMVLDIAKAIAHGAIAFLLGGQPMPSGVDRYYTLLTPKDGDDRDNGTPINLITYEALHYSLVKGLIDGVIGGDLHKVKVLMYNSKSEGMAKH